MGKRNGPEKFHELANGLGYIWVEAFPVPGRLDKTEWICPKKHRLIKSYNSMKRGYHCDTCSRKRPLTKIDYDNTAEKINFKWVGKKLPANNDEKTDWLCPKGHIWKIQYRVFVDRVKCAVCFREKAENVKNEKQTRSKNRKNRPKTLEDYLALAEIRSIKFIGDKIPKNASTKTSWMCFKGHIRYSTYNTIHKKGKTECQQCKNLTKDDYVQMALQKNITWKGRSLPKNSHSLTDWECPNGHTWEARYSNIQQDKGCPYCKNKSEEECRTIFEFLFNEKFPKRKPKWLKLIKNTRNLELDGYCEKLQIAFEYDGGQHFYPVKWWGGKKYLRQVKKRDKLKDLACKDKNVVLIRISYKIKNKMDYIISKLTSKGIRVNIKK